MRKFEASFIDVETYKNNKREPNFNNLLKVLKQEKADRPTLFEFFMNNTLYYMMVNENISRPNDDLAHYRVLINAFKNAGYDYTTVGTTGFGFQSNRHQDKGSKSISLNDGAVIFNRESFEKYSWENPSSYDYSIYEKLADELPDGMKLVASGPGGVLENVIELVGYESLCYMLVDDPELANDIFCEVGSRLVSYYDICSKPETVGALISNDDWGFKTQTMLSVKDMRQYVFPWHKKIVETIHNAGKPVILHSCGNLELVMDDITNDMAYDGKHSYEDIIMPVEECYLRWSKDIALLGGIDVDFLCRSTPEDVYYRSVKMLEKGEKGAYALGSGNSIPEYIPVQSYLAMIAAANFGME